MSRDRDSAQRGETLVELLVAIAILGITAAGLLGAVAMVVNASALTDRDSRSAAILRAWGEYLEDGPYSPCADPEDIATPPAPTGWAGAPPTWSMTDAGAHYTAQVREVEHWDDTRGSFRRACPDDSGVARVTLSVTADGAGLPGAPEQLVVALRNPCLSLAEAGCRP